MSEQSVFSEVDEELRRDRLRALWRRFGPYLIGAAVAVVALVGVNEGWRWWQESNAARSSDLLYAALDAAQKGDTEAARTGLEKTIAEGTGDYPLLARFRQAGLLVKAGKTDDAVTAYDAIASDAKEQRLRELALVLGALQLTEKGDVTAISARVGGIISSASPLRNMALEALGLTQYKAGDLQAAADSFQAIMDDPGAAAQQVGRIRVYLAQLTAEGVTPTSQQQQDTGDAAAPASDAAAPGADTTAPASDAAAPAGAATDSAAPAADPAPAN